MCAILCILVIESSPERLTSHKDLDGAAPPRPNPNDATPPVGPFRPIRASANPALKDGASAERVALVSYKNLAHSVFAKVHIVVP
jgi:hypothetical protein